MYKSMDCLLNYVTSQDTTKIILASCRLAKEYTLAKGAQYLTDNELDQMLMCEREILLKKQAELEIDELLLEIDINTQTKGGVE